MATYSSSAELAHNALREGDTVIFKVLGRVLSYTVEEDYLNLREGSNDYVFHALGVDKTQVAREAYGYEPNGGDWPEFAHRDWNAATRLVMKLFEIIESRAERSTARITNTKELADASPIRVDDMIFFTVGEREIPMFVERDSDGFYLHSRSCSGRGVVFAALGMDGSRQRREFARAAVGSSPSRGSWDDHPQYRDVEDFTKLVHALLVKCGQDVPAQEEGEEVPSLVGKQFKDEDGDVVVILADLGVVVMRSDYNNPASAGTWYTREEFFRRFRPVDDTAKKVITMTKAEIVAKLGLGDVELQIAA